MITISIKSASGEKSNVEIYPFDSDIDVLKRYTVSHQQSQYGAITLPQFLKFVKEPSEFIEGKTYKIQNVEDELTDIKFVELGEQNIYLRLQSRYPSLNRQTIVYLWFIVNIFGNEIDKDQFDKIYEDLNAKEVLSHLHNRSLVTAENAYNAIIKYRDKTSAAINSIRRSLEREDKIHEGFNNNNINNKEIKVDAFSIKEVVEDLFIDLPNEESLYYVFDLASVSRDVPCIMLFDEGKTFFKVYQDFVPPDAWITFDPNAETDYNSRYVNRAIYFYIANTSSDNTANNHTAVSGGDIENDKYRKKYFTMACWNENNSVRLSTISEEIEIESINNKSSQVIKDKLFNSLKKRLEFNLIDTVQVSIKGKFTIFDEVFNRAVMSDLILNNKDVSYYLFMDEHERSSLDKPRFVFYFSHNQQGVPSASITVTLTQNKLKGNSWIDVRVSKARTLKQVDNFISIFKRIFSFYLSQYKQIVTAYKDLYTNVDFQKFIMTKKTKVKVDVKSGVRLKALEEFNPEAFKKGGYATKCQPTRRQPYLVQESDIKNVKKKFNEAKTQALRDGLKKHGLLNWPKGSKDWYACYPREPTDDSPDFIWPGFVCLDNKEERPCCFKIDQFAKKGSLLNYESTGKFKCEGEKEDAVISTSFSRPLNSNKHVTPGKFGEIPYYVQIIAIHAKVKTEKIKTKIGLPILRYGVMDDPASFVHCVEAAVRSDEYFKLTIDEKRQRVKDELNSIVDENDDYFVVIKQELYDYNYHEIKGQLIRENAYIDSDIYLPLFEKRNGCNIMVFQRDNENPNGELPIQRHSIAYLSYKPFSKKKSGGTIVIVKFQTETGEYQCELVVKYDKGKIQYIFDDSDPFIAACFDIRNSVNNVYMTSYERSYKKITATVTI